MNIQIIPSKAIIEFFTFEKDNVIIGFIYSDTKNHRFDGFLINNNYDKAPYKRGILFVEDSFSKVKDKMINYIKVKSNVC